MTYTRTIPERSWPRRPSHHGRPARRSRRSTSSWGRRRPTRSPPTAPRRGSSRSQSCASPTPRRWPATLRTDRAARRVRRALPRGGCRRPCSPRATIGRRSQGRTVVVIPPGRQRDRAGVAGSVVRIFSARTEDVMARCRNADAFIESDPHVTPCAAVAGSGGRLSHPHLPAGGRAGRAGRFGRIFRCSTIMVNYCRRTTGRGTRASCRPHHHDDFEQISLQLQGSLRAPHAHAVDRRHGPLARRRPPLRGRRPSRSSRRPRSTPARA